MAQKNADVQVIGYAEPWIVSPGERVDIKVSTTEKHYTHRLVRLTQGYNGPDAPPFVEEEIVEVPTGHRDDGSKPSCFFNGRLDSPSFATTGSARRILAQYDFSRDISSDSITDVSGNGQHGTLINAPTRAVKGYNWDGSEPDWTKARYGYGAIHFHEDDLDDAKWSTNFPIAIPSTARSGAYAVEVKCSDGTRDMVTFFVRPNPASTARVALVLTTFTYLAYANERMFDQTRSSAMTTPDGVSIGSGNEYYKTLEQRPDLGLSAYDVHRDGSPCAYSSALRPIMNVRPHYVHWALDRPREFSADLLMIGFLERSGIPYDVVTDHCMHTRGEEAVSQYETLITGCHPEYHSLQTLDAFGDFAKSGGNLMYLGGNGFYWVAEIDTKRPHRFEVRKGDQGCRSVTFPAGERMHSLTGAQGGLWRSRGRAPNYLFGVGPCAFGTGEGVPYRANMQSAQDPSFAWVFNGINLDEPIGKHGFGGGASGDEIDRLDYELGSPANTILLARSERHDDSFGLFNEDQMFPMVNTLGSTCDRVRSDMVYYATAGGGAVFSVGSINWYSSLAWRGYDNNVAKLTDNVLREFVRRGKGHGQ
ncbi:hypothetical protein BJY04DRAFT_212775 [Aspergillus karnatakaensis]|uniref:N,N-dimethylformamidase beta subunit family domain-containing protein n=1 Tax=Aspergillus karnatakaensis TaxID=1810916 RepID=UPI003CCDC71D